MLDWIYEFPQMNPDALRDLKRGIDDTFRNFSRSWGSQIEAFFDPLRQMLVQAERLLIATPWPVVLLVVGVLAWAGSRSVRLTLATILTLLVIGYFGMWQDTMRTVSMVLVCTILAIVVGIPLGILAARSDRVQSLITPVLDIMQTMPSFVYLIPVVMLLGIGRVAGMMAVVVYALPPIVRLTNLGIRLVDREVIEAADSFGSSRWQKLRKVQLPLALPTIMAGINQTIMMTLAMVVIASMIGVQGLGSEVLKAISNQYFTLGMFNGFAIVGIAIIFDRISQAFGRRLQKHHGGQNA